MKKLMQQFLGPLADHLVPVVDNGQRFYPAPDICRMLEIRNVSLAIKVIPRTEKIKHRVFNGVRVVRVWHLTEIGIYLLILHCRKRQPKYLRNMIGQTLLPRLANQMELEQPKPATA